MTEYPEECKPYHCGWLWADDPSGLVSVTHKGRGVFAGRFMERLIDRDYQDLVYLKAGKDHAEWEAQVMA